MKEEAKRKKKLKMRAGVMMHARAWDVGLCICTGCLTLALPFSVQVQKYIELIYVHTEDCGPLEP